MRKLRRAFATSCGGVIFQVGNPGPEIVLVGREQPRICALPKGTPRPGESSEQTAIREASEETGLLVRILEPIGEVSYTFVFKGARYHKSVRYYLMAPSGGDFSLHDPEYDHVEWAPIDEAVTRMSYPNEVEIVQRASRLIERRLTLRDGDRRASAAGSHPAG